MGEMVQAAKYHAKKEMLDFLNYMGDEAIESAGKLSVSPDETALNIRFGLILKKYASNLQHKIFTEDDCRYVYKELKANEARRMAWLENSCLERWQKDYRNREARSRAWERFGLDDKRQEFGIDTEVDAHRAFKDSFKDYGNKPTAKSFDDFLKDGKLPDTPELDMSGVGRDRDSDSRGR